MEWFSNLKDWSDEHAGLIALLGFVLVPVTGYFALMRARSGQVTMADQLGDATSWPGLIEDFRKGRSEGYFAAIGRVLRLAERVYGPTPLSMHAFNRCLTIAYAYPVVAFVVGWVAANQTAPGGLALFQDDPHMWSRLGKALLILAAAALAGWILANADRFSRWILDRLLSPLDTDTPRVGFLSKATRGVLELVAFAVALAVAGVGGFAVVAALAGAGVVAYVGTLAIAVVGVVTAAGVIAGAGVFTVAVAVAGDAPTAGVLLLLFFFLPILNAFADMLSLAATRFFLSHVAPATANAASPKRPTLARILGQLVLDLGVALLCLALLLGSILVVLEIWTRLSPASLPLDWRAYRAEVQADWNAGWALYLMAATTLLPTAIHVAAGLGAVLTHRSRLLGRVATRLEKAQADGQTALPERDRAQLVGQVHVARFWGHGVAILIVIPMTLGLMVLIFRAVGLILG